MKMNNELNIILQVLDGNPGSFARLVDTYKNLVFSLVLKIVRNREEAEEITQDTFIKAYNALGSFKHEAKFSTWLFRIAYNTAISRTRKRTITTSTIDEYVIENFSIDSVQENLESSSEADRLKILNLAIESLTDDEQLLINLFYFNQQGIEEIGIITGLSASNVKVRLHRIRKKMYIGMQNQLNKLQIS